MRGRAIRPPDGAHLFLPADLCLLGSPVLLLGTLLAPHTDSLLRRECVCLPGVDLRCALLIWVAKCGHPCGAPPASPCPHLTPLAPHRPLLLPAGSPLGSTCNFKNLSQHHPHPRQHRHNPYHYQENHRNPRLRMKRRKILRQVISNKTDGLTYPLYSYSIWSNSALRPLGGGQEKSRLICLFDNS